VDGLDIRAVDDSRHRVGLDVGANWLHGPSQPFFRKSQRHHYGPVAGRLGGVERDAEWAIVLLLHAVAGYAERTGSGREPERYPHGIVCSLRVGRVNLSALDHPSYDFGLIFGPGSLLRAGESVLGKSEWSPDGTMAWRICSGCDPAAGVFCAAYYLPLHGPSVRELPLSEFASALARPAEPSSFV
jgi:hypothetical protein